MRAIMTVGHPIVFIVLVALLNIKVTTSTEPLLNDTIIQNQIQSNLLKLFGFSTRPKVDRSKVVIPNALLDIYNEMMATATNSVNFPKNGLLTKSANTVRSFTHEESKIDERFKHHDRRYRLYFNVSSIPDDEVLNGAEIKLTKRPSPKKKYKILVYDIVRPGIKRKLDPIFVLVDTKTISHKCKEDTINLDILPAVKRWLKKPNENYGLLLVVNTYPINNHNYNNTIHNNNTNNNNKNNNNINNKNNNTNNNNNNINNNNNNNNNNKNKNKNKNNKRNNYYKSYQQYFNSKNKNRNYTNKIYNHISTNNNINNYRNSNKNISNNNNNNNNNNINNNNINNNNYNSYNITNNDINNNNNNSNNNNNNNNTSHEHYNNHIRLKRNVHDKQENWEQQQPFLLTYSNDGRQHAYNFKTKRERRAPSRRQHRRKDGKEICQRKALYVDFSSVGWSDWIVAPPGYDAYYCQGECTFPIPDHLNSTNHAVVQTLVNSINPNMAPRACCIPTQLNPISMLYLDDKNKVVLKNYQDMSVVGCGCR